MFGVLAVGTTVRVVSLRGFTDEKTQSHLKSVRSWWVLLIILTIALMFGKAGVALLLAVAGILALREHLQIIGWKEVGTLTAWIVFAVAPIFYSLLLFGYSDFIRSSAPVAILIALGAVRACLGLIEDFIRTTAALIWGGMLFVYCLSHAYFLVDLSGFPKPWIGNLGWFLYLILLTETNDLAQAWIGRPFGRTKIAPRTSPNKSLEGLLGGIAVTTILAFCLAPFLASFMHSSWVSGVLLSTSSGVLISVFGFLGDLNKSGIKRDVGIKDSGTILPGQGGMMDRIDIDGKLARWLHQRSDFGARLDSFADAVLYGGLFFGLFWFRGEVLYHEAVWWIVGLLSYLLTTGTGLWKYGRVPSYHTYGAKISQWLVLAGAICLLLDYSIWPFRVAMVLVTLTNL